MKVSENWYKFMMQVVSLKDLKVCILRLKDLFEFCVQGCFKVKLW